jgi:hypothetical protein
MTLIAAGGHMSTSYLGENFLDSVVCASSDGGVTWTTNIIDGTLGLGFLSTAASAAPYISRPTSERPSP